MKAYGNYIAQTSIAPPQELFKPLAENASQVAEHLGAKIGEITFAFNLPHEWKDDVTGETISGFKSQWTASL